MAFRDDVDEVIARVDPLTGEKIGEVSKALAHREGLWHATIHVWVLDDQGRLVFQHRSTRKAHRPGLWGVSVGGHVGLHEDGTREVAEEIGALVALEDLEFIGVLTIDEPLSPGHDREKPRVYLWRSDRAIDSFRFVDEEVTDLAAVARGDLARLLAGDDVTCEIFDGTRVATGVVSGRDLVALSAEYWARVCDALDD